MEICKSSCYHELASHLQEKYILRDKHVKELIYHGDRMAILNRCKRMQEKVKASISFDYEKCELNPIAKGVIECDGYRVEKYVIQSFLGSWLPINVYVPTDKKGPFPAVLEPIGHNKDGKAVPEVQRLCANLALRGIIAATFDPICQGERKVWSDLQLDEYLSNIPEDMRVVSMHMIPGNLYYMLGRNLMSQFIQDGRRTIDFLCTRSDVDSNRIGVTGQSGGGTQATYLAALDERVKVYSPIQCLSKQAIALSKGIGDCEQSLLDISADDAFDYPDIMWAAFPKPVMMNCGYRDQFEIEGAREVEAEMIELYDVFGLRNDFSMKVADCTHKITLETRLYAYEWLTKYLVADTTISEEVETPIFSASELSCFSGQINGGDSLLGASYFLEQDKGCRVHSPIEIKQKLKELLKVYSRKTWIENLMDNRFLMHVENAETISFSFSGDARKPLCILLSDDVQLRENLCEKYYVVNAVPWGMAETYSKVSKAYDTETCIFNAAVVSGKSIMSDRVNEIVALTDYILEQTGKKEVNLIGKKAGALVALYCAAIKEYKSTLLIECPVSFDAMFQNEMYLLPETMIVPGVIQIGDIKDIMSASEGCINLSCPVDACGEIIPNPSEKASENEVFYKRGGIM